MFYCHKSDEMSYGCVNEGLHEVWTWGEPGYGYSAGVATFVEFEQDGCGSRLDNYR